MFQFTIVATLPDVHAERFSEWRFEDRRSDSTVDFRNGCILIDFSREARSLERAITSAVVSVRKAGAVVERIEPDPLVNLADMASRASKSRAAMTQYCKGRRQGGFPPAKVRLTTTSPLWDWAEVSLWLLERGRIARTVAIQAAVLRAANDALGSDADFASALRQRVRAGEKDGSFPSPEEEDARPKSLT